MTANRVEFDRRLQAIEGRVSEVFGMVAQDLPHATQALLGDGGGDVTAALAGREEVIDNLYPEIEDIACREILLEAPVASDLRFLLSVLRIVPELERSHDLIMQIAASAGVVRGADLPPRQRALTTEMGDLAAGMWRQAADAWRTRDGAAASAVGERDERMRRLHTTVTAEIAASAMPAPVTMEMTLAARCYDRLGAHAVNVTRRVAASLAASARAR